MSGIHLIPSRYWLQSRIQYLVPSHSLSAKVPAIQELELGIRVLLFTSNCSILQTPGSPPLRRFALTGTLGVWHCRGHTASDEPMSPCQWFSKVALQARCGWSQTFQGHVMLSHVLVGTEAEFDSQLKPPCLCRFRSSFLHPLAGLSIGYRHKAPQSPSGGRSPGAVVRHGPRSTWKSRGIQNLGRIKNIARQILD